MANIYQTKVFFYDIQKYKRPKAIGKNLHINKFYWKIGRVRAYDAKNGFSFNAQIEYQTAFLAFSNRLFWGTFFEFPTAKCI